VWRAMLGTNLSRVGILILGRLCSGSSQNQPSSDMVDINLGLKFSNKPVFESFSRENP